MCRAFRRRMRADLRCQFWRDGLMIHQRPAKGLAAFVHRQNGARGAIHRQRDDRGGINLRHQLRHGRQHALPPVRRMVAQAAVRVGGCPLRHAIARTIDGGGPHARGADVDTDSQCIRPHAASSIQKASNAARSGGVRCR